MLKRGFLCSLLFSFSVTMRFLFLWLIMLNRVNYARGCAHFFYFEVLVCLPFILYAFHFCLYGSVSAPCSPFRSRVLVSQHSCFACTFLFDNVARHHKLFWKPSRRQTFFAPCIEAYGLHLVWKPKNYGSAVRRIGKWDKRKRKVITAYRYYCLRYQVLCVPILDYKNKRFPNILRGGQNT